MTSYMNVLSLVVNTYIIVAALVIFLLSRDLLADGRPPQTKKITSKRFSDNQTGRWQKIRAILLQPHYYFLGSRRKYGIILIIILALGVILAVDARYIESGWLKIQNVDLKISNLQKPLKIALITDIQVGNDKKSAWVEKLITEVENAKPDLVLLGGDLIDNEGTAEDESVYLKPFYRLAKKYPIYYVLGNHEYGIGSRTIFSPVYRTGDHSQMLIDQMKEIGIPLLKNQLACPEINQQKICLYGLDDLWNDVPKFKELKNWDQKLPLILFSHNPDGILYWPQNFRQPDLELSGHTHGGQIRLPFIGPLGDAEIDLPKNFYQGLNYYDNVPVYTSVGAGESGGPIRLFTRPEIVFLNLTP